MFQPGTNETINNLLIEGDVQTGGTDDTPGPTTNNLTSALNKPTSTPSQPKKRQKMTTADAQREFMESCSKALAESASHQEVDETEALGILVAKKLQRMDPIQAILAEDLINSVLRKGLMKQLTETTVVMEPQRNFGSVSSAFSSGFNSYSDGQSNQSFSDGQSNDLSAYAALSTVMRMS